MNLERLLTELDSFDTFKLEELRPKLTQTPLHIRQDIFRLRVVPELEHEDTDSLGSNLRDREDVVKLPEGNNPLNLVAEALQDYFNHRNNSLLQSIPEQYSAATQVKDFQHSQICGCSSCCRNQIATQSNSPQTDQYFETVSFFSTFGGTWSQPGGKGNPVNITYSYSNLLDGSMQGLNNAEMTDAIEEAFGLWSSVAPLNFTEVPDSASNAQIRIGQEDIDGRNGTLAFAYAPSNGDIRFDNGENWNQSLFLETAVHEIGHSLGLGHENSQSAIMNPTIKNRFNGLGSGFLLEDDINGIRSLYGSGSGSVNPLGSNPTTTTPTPTGFEGTNEDDLLVGDNQANLIRGLAGDDYLEGGLGNDTLEGGSGADTLAFSSLDGSVDTIVDFSSAEGDRLQVSLAGFGSGSSFRYNSNSGALLFGDEEFALLANKPSFSEVVAGFVAS